MADIIDFPKDKIKQIRLVSDNPVLAKTREDIANFALTAMLADLAANGININHPKMAYRNIIISRILIETLKELDGHEISDYMKKIMLII